MYDLAVIGIGRVGLPLALLFAQKGLQVLGVDCNQPLIDSVRKNKMPFFETGCQELMDKGVHIATSTHITDCSQANYVIITVGTPFMDHIEMNLGHINQVLEELIPVLQKGQTIILRSTVAVGTTEFVQKRIEAQRNWTVGQDFYMAFAPERILEGKFLEEMRTIPQPIGVADELSFEKARSLFQEMTTEVFHSSFRGAELVKLFCNTGRYVYFALSNYLFMVAENFNEDIHELLHMTNHHYPRPILYGPGFTAGSCLRKDFAMISEQFPQMDLFLAAWRINESLPKVLVSHIEEKASIYDKKIAVLGFTFKKDSDDTRDSLIPKLIRYLLRHVPREVAVAEPNLEPGVMLDCGYIKLENKKVEECLTHADVVILAYDHTTFTRDWKQLEKLIKPGALMVDVWNMTGKGKMYFHLESHKYN